VVVDALSSALAACRDHPHPEWWGPERGSGSSNADDAKRTCAQCPVIRPCLETALANREEHGIRGGAGGQLRRWLRRAWVAGADVWEEAFSQHLARLDGDQVVVDMNGPRAMHGRPVTYARGCRCAACGPASADRDLELTIVGDRSGVADLAVGQAWRVPGFLLAAGGWRERRLPASRRPGSRQRDGRALPPGVRPVPADSAPRVVVVDTSHRGRLP
jgi:WhiB family redox-sensing transcriptional regulator